MVQIVANQWKFRVLNNQLLEATPTEGPENWHMRSLVELDISGGQYAVIRDHLIALSNVIPNEHVAMPVVEQEQQTVVNPTDPR